MHIRDRARWKLQDDLCWTSSGLTPALMCRLALVPSPTPAGRELASKLVSQHMARALYMPADCRYNEIAYTVEPILAYAASRIMNHFSKSCLTQLHRLTSSCLIQKAPCGQLLTKMAFTLAFGYDAPTEDSKDYLLKPKSLLDFLCRLSTEPPESSLMHRKPAHPSKKVQKLDDIGKATCVIAQFVKSQGSPNGITDSAINQSIATSTVIETPPNTADADLLFACVLDENEPVHPGNVVLVVGKSESRKVSVARDPQFKSYRKRGYTVVYILHECGGRQPFSFTFKEPPVCSSYTAPLLVLLYC